MPDDPFPYRPVRFGQIPADHPMLDTGPIVDLMGVHAAGLEQARVEALRAEGEFFASLRRAAAMGPCTTCGTPYDECEISADEPDYTTDANGNHEGLCCEDCGHPAIEGGGDNG